MRRRLTLAVLLVVAVAAVTACGSVEGGGGHASGPAGTSLAAASASWEAVLSGRTSRMERLDGRDVLVVGGIQPAITLFTDRPRRLMGELGPAEFLALWRGGAFSANPPNAAIVTDGEAVGVELVGAEYDATADTVRFTVRALPSVGSATAVPTLSVGAHGQTALFIDALPTAVNSQITDSVSQANVRVIGEAPALAMGQLYQSIALSLGLDPRQALNAT